MRESIKKFIMGILVCMCIIWTLSFDPTQFETWFVIAACVGGVTWFWWYICGFENPFTESFSEDE